ncbi:MAG: RsmG family class I SAM-dependent methyltransferase, partial [Alphaproteobacteria bacterium]
MSARASAVVRTVASTGASAGPLPEFPKPSGPPAPLTIGEFQAAADVSRETLARLEAYVALLKKWNRRINLVSRRGLDDVWRRHVLDSLQLLPYRGAGDVNG